jgi:hypothetical protein
MKKLFQKTVFILTGLAALIWFLVRVIPKPSRAAYPCQRAAFPVASAFVLWVVGVVSSYFGLKYLQRKWLWLGGSVVVLVLAAWLLVFPPNILRSEAAVPEFVPATGFDWKPGPSNRPVGSAKGLFPGRVVLVRDPKATHWAGNWKVKSDQWWLDANTDKDRVEAMLSSSLRKLTGAKTDEMAWSRVFGYYHQSRRGKVGGGYRAGEVVAVKINLNNSSVDKSDNQTDATPQMVLAVVRQLVHKAGVAQKDILVYDARRPIYPYMLTEIWNEFKDVRFLQENPADPRQPFNPAYGDHTGLEGADWVDGVTYSSGKYDKAKLIPRQVKEATYLVNLALLKLHSYPYNYMEDGDEGQTALTMSGKNHAGSIKGTSELHSILNTKKEGVKNAYSPLVDLAASPNLGGKTILYLLDGLYCGRKWRSYPLHFPNPPFNNQTEPYENPQWPSCVLASFDEVAIQSVGLDIFQAQVKNNTEPSYHNVPRILIRDNADDFLREMASPQQAPSGVRYVQDGKPVQSLGVTEHWDDDGRMRYSRNLNPRKGKGIEFIHYTIE